LLRRRADAPTGGPGGAADPTGIVGRGEAPVTV
jgi:hypothetical protein